MAHDAGLRLKAVQDDIEPVSTSGTTNQNNTDQSDYAPIQSAQHQALQSLATPASSLRPLTASRVLAPLAEEEEDPDDEPQPADPAPAVAKGQQPPAHLAPLDAPVAAPLPFHQAPLPKAVAQHNVAIRPVIAPAHPPLPPAQPLKHQVLLALTTNDLPKLQQLLPPRSLFQKALGIYRLSASDYNELLVYSMNNQVNDNVHGYLQQYMPLSAQQITNIENLLQQANNIHINRHNVFLIHANRYKARDQRLSPSQAASYAINAVDLQALRIVIPPLWFFQRWLRLYEIAAQQRNDLLIQAMSQQNSEALCQYLMNYMPLSRANFQYISRESAMLPVNSAQFSQLLNHPQFPEDLIFDLLHRVHDQRILQSLITFCESTPARKAKFDICIKNTLLRLWEAAEKGNGGVVNQYAEMITSERAAFILERTAPASLFARIVSMRNAGWIPNQDAVARIIEAFQKESPLPNDLFLRSVIFNLLRLHTNTISMNARIILLHSLCTQQQYASVLATYPQNALLIQRLSQQVPVDTLTEISLASQEPLITPESGLQLGTLLVSAAALPEQQGTRLIDRIVQAAMTNNKKRKTEITQQHVINALSAAVAAATHNSLGSAVQTLLQAPETLKLPKIPNDILQQHIDNTRTRLGQQYSPIITKLKDAKSFF
ncbi:MAG: hypothetical protein HY861_00080 [Chlamydiia bacterium]|nr:hypothetical protein [Chlamydiia bacterium]